MIACRNDRVLESLGAASSPLWLQRMSPCRSRVSVARMTRLTLRIDFDDERALGPGKVRLLELIGETGSISAAGRAMGMSYRRAWLLVDALNKTFRAAVVATREGGAGGGGASLTTFGGELVASYRAMELDAARAVRQKIAKLESALA